MLLLFWFQLKRVDSKQQLRRENRATGEVEGQTRQHVRLLALLGVEQIIVGINKMDTCDWSETRYNEIKDEFFKMLKDSGLKPMKIPFIPYSGFHGENLIEKTDKMPWYKGWSANLSKDNKVTGFTILDALEKLIKPPKRIQMVRFVFQLVVYAISLV